MGTETVPATTSDNSCSTTTTMSTSDPDLLTQWLESLETRSSLFWLHYVQCNLAHQKHQDQNEAENACSSNSSASSCTSSTSMDNGSNVASDVGSVGDEEQTFCAPSGDEPCSEAESCKKNSIVLRTKLSVRVHTIIEKLSTSEGRELRRALFSLKQIFQEDKDLVHEFVQNDGLACLIKVGSEADQNYQNYILRALGQVMLYVDGMNGVMQNNHTIQWLYSLIKSKFRLVVKTALKLLLVFVEYVDSNCSLLIKAIQTVDSNVSVPCWHNVMRLLNDFEAADTELLIYATTLINKCLNGVPEPDAYYDQIDALEEQHFEAIVQRYMAKQGTDLDLLQQFQIYEAVLQYEDGSDKLGTAWRHLDEATKKTLRNRQAASNGRGDNGRRRSRRYIGVGAKSATVVHSVVQSNGSNQEDDEDEESSSSQSSGVVHLNNINGGFKECNKANDAGVTPALRRRRERAERQRSFMKEQEQSTILSHHRVVTTAANENDSNGIYTNGVQQRLLNGNNVLNRNASRKDITPLLNAVNKLDSDELTNNNNNNNNNSNNNLSKHILIMQYNANNENDTSAQLAGHANDDNEMFAIKRENTVKDLTQKLSQVYNAPGDEEKKNLRIVDDMTGVISKAMEGLAKSKSQANVGTKATDVATAEVKKAAEVKKSENELRWEELASNLDRPLNLCDMDFTDLASDDETDLLAPVTTSNGVPPPPPPLVPTAASGVPPPPPPNRISSLNHSVVQPPPPPLATNLNVPTSLFGVSLTRPRQQQPQPPPPPQLQQQQSAARKSKKTVKLFWKEVRDDAATINANTLAVRAKTGFLWDELQPVPIDTQKLEHLFESRAKDIISKKQQESNKTKEIIVLDPKRSNAINIGMTKLPPPRTIKTAILKMDATIMNREGIEKLLTMLPTDEERTRIQEAQTANPDLPLGSAEQFLLTLASISELPARLRLWAFKLDFENTEREIAEPLMDLKQGCETLKSNKTFRGILSTLLSIGNFLNGNNVKGFQIEYLAKVPEVKDTVHKHSLLHHLCHIVMEKFPEATDLYSEIGAVTRASKVDFDELGLNIQRLESDCKTSWDHLKLIAKHDGSTMKAKMSDFLSDCAERIILLGIIFRRIINRFHRFLLWLGMPTHQVSDTKANEFCRIVSEFALEYRTTRERVLQQLEKKANHRERNKTRGRLITESGKYGTTTTSEDRADAELRQLLGNDLMMSPATPTSDADFGTWRRTGGRRSATPQQQQQQYLNKFATGNEDDDDAILESLVKTAAKVGLGSGTRTAPRERKRTRHADRKSLRRTLKNGLSEEEKKHISAYIKGY